MSEIDVKKIENAAQNAAEDIAKEAAQAADDHENAPRRVQEEEKKEKAGKKGGKKRRKRRKKGVPVQYVALLLVITLFFGAVLGYAVGRNAVSRQLAESKARVAELSAALEEASSAEYDAFDNTLTEDNIAALADLSGEGFHVETPKVNPLLSEDNLLTGETVQKNPDEQVVVAEFAGGVLLSDEVRREYNQQLANYTFEGYDVEEIAGEVLDEVLDYMVYDKVLALRAGEMGVYELTSADLDQIETETRRQYADELDFAKLYVRKAGMNESEVEAAAQEYLRDEAGVTIESVRAEVENGWWEQKLYDAVVKNVTVTASDIQMLYKAKLEEQQQNFESHPEDYEYAQRAGETLVYNLPGYRAVKLLKIGFDSAEDIDAVLELAGEIADLDPRRDSERYVAATAQLDDLYADCEARMQDILNRLSAGEDFDTLLAQYGEDEDMRKEEIFRTGYYISETSVVWSPAIIQATMALENIGDISPIIRLEDGVCILRYMGDVKAGAVAQADVYDSIYAETLDQARDEAYGKQVDAWIKAANPVYYPERMQ